MNQIQKLKDRVFGGKSEGSDVTALVDLVRELGCLSDIVGREFEVFSVKGDLLYRIKQRALSPVQIKLLLDELHVLRKMESDEMKKGSRRKR